MCLPKFSITPTILLFSRIPHSFPESLLSPIIPYFQQLSLFLRINFFSHNCFPHNSLLTLTILPSLSHFPVTPTIPCHSNNSLLPHIPCFFPQFPLSSAILCSLQQLFILSHHFLFSSIVPHLPQFPLKHNSPFTPTILFFPAVPFMSHNYILSQLCLFPTILYSLIQYTII